MQSQDGRQQSLVTALPSRDAAPTVIGIVHSKFLITLPMGCIMIITHGIFRIPTGLHQQPYVFYSGSEDDNDADDGLYLSFYQLCVL